MSYFFDQASIPSDLQPLDKVGFIADIWNWGGGHPKWDLAIKFCGFVAHQGLNPSILEEGFRGNSMVPFFQTCREVCLEEGNFKADLIEEAYTEVYTPFLTFLQSLDFKGIKNPQEFELLECYKAFLVEGLYHVESSEELSVWYRESCLLGQALKKRNSLIFLRDVITAYAVYHGLEGIKPPPGWCGEIPQNLLEVVKS